MAFAQRHQLPLNYWCYFIHHFCNRYWVHTLEMCKGIKYSAHCKFTMWMSMWVYILASLFVDEWERERAKIMMGMRKQTHGKLILHLTHKLTFNKCQCLIIWERQFQMEWQRIADVRAAECLKWAPVSENIYMMTITMTATTTATATTTNGYSKCKISAHSHHYRGPFSPLQNDFCCNQINACHFWIHFRWRERIHTEN